MKNQKKPRDVIGDYTCPECGGQQILEKGDLVCTKCGNAYPLTRRVVGR